MLSGPFSAGLKTYSYQIVTCSAKVESYVYSVFPIRKNIRLRVYEDMGGSANFEYFYLKHNGTARASKTWPSITGSWTGILSTALVKTDKEYALQTHFIIATMLFHQVLGLILESLIL